MTKEDLLKLRAKTQVLIEMQRMNLQLLDDHLKEMLAATEDAAEDAEAFPQPRRNLFQLIREVKEYSALQAEQLSATYPSTFLPLDLKVACMAGGSGGQYHIVEGRLFWESPLQLHDRLATGIAVLTVVGTQPVRLDMKEMKALDPPLNTLALHQLEEIVNRLNRALTQA